MYELKVKNAAIMRSDDLIDFIPKMMENYIHQVTIVDLDTGREVFNINKPSNPKQKALLEAMMLRNDWFRVETTHPYDIIGLPALLSFLANLKPEVEYAVWDMGRNPIHRLVYTSINGPETDHIISHAIKRGLKHLC